MKKYIVQHQGLSYSINGDYLDVNGTTGVTLIRVKEDKAIVAVVPHSCTVFLDDNINKPEKAVIQSIAGNGKSKFHN